MGAPQAMKGIWLECKIKTDLVSNKVIVNPKHLEEFGANSVEVFLKYAGNVVAGLLELSEDVPESEVYVPEEIARALNCEEGAAINIEKK